MVTGPSGPRRCLSRAPILRHQLAPSSSLQQSLLNRPESRHPGVTTHLRSYMMRAQAGNSDLPSCLVIG